jgi:hypothetical protein
LNNHGELGDGSTNFMNTIPLVVTGLTNVVMIAPGQNHALAVLSNGTVIAWGANYYGQLGIGSMIPAQTNIPVQVPGLSNVVLAAAGYAHSVVVLSNGTVWTWGDNHYNSLGSGTNALWTTSPAIVSNDFRLVGWDDPDGDGLPTYKEVETYGTNPDNPDTDGDGMNDGWEVTYQGSGFNPTVAQTGSTAARADLDNDGLSNQQESQRNTHPNNQDTDADGILDGPFNTNNVAGVSYSLSGIADAFPTDASKKVDTDGDGVDDSADSDDDNDGLPDADASELVNSNNVIPITVAPFKTVNIETNNPSGDSLSEVFDFSSRGCPLPYAQEAAPLTGLAGSTAESTSTTTRPISTSASLDLIPTGPTAWSSSWIQTGQAVV